MSGQFTEPGDKLHISLLRAGNLVPPGEGEGCRTRSALGLREGAEAPVRRLLQEVGKLPLLVGQHAVGRPRGRSVSFDLISRNLRYENLIHLPSQEAPQVRRYPRHAAAHPHASQLLLRSGPGSR